MYDLRLEYINKKNTILNIKIINVLTDLISKLKLKKSAKDYQRIISLEKALITIKNNQEEITSGKEAIKLDNIGKGIAARIDEILETNTLKEIEELDNYILQNPSLNLKNELCKITGVGEVKAEKLIEMGVTSINDLINKWKTGIIKVEKNALTHHIAVGLEFYYDLLERIPWEEAHKIAKFLQKEAVAININTTVCGSYRRQLETCGDIDVLITHEDYTNDEDIEKSNILLNYVKNLKDKGFLVGDLTTAGKTKYMGVCKYKGSIGRRIDIRFISKNAYPCALLYFTGSGLFNKIMRNKANEMGYTLNEYGIFKLTKDGKNKGEQIIVHTEKEIFDLINCIFIEPKDRNFT
jgi:DNA polymerase/3'-5' exonuclease PolX